MFTAALLAAINEPYCSTYCSGGGRERQRRWNCQRNLWAAGKGVCRIEDSGLGMIVCFGRVPTATHRSRMIIWRVAMITHNQAAPAE